jgi:hypothetical protein
MRTDLAKKLESQEDETTEDIKITYEKLDQKCEEALKKIKSRRKKRLRVAE